MQRVFTQTITTIKQQRPLFLILKRTMASASSSVTFPGPLVSVDWLKQNYSKVKVVDGSFYMPNEKIDPKATYLKAHLPQAVFFDLEECTSKDGPAAGLPHMLPSKEQFSEYMGALGLTESDAIVVYDGKGVFSSPRIRLTMKYFGAKNVAILEGGFKAWAAAGEKTESGEPPKPKPVKFNATTPPAKFVKTMDEIEANSKAANPEFTVIDARSKGRYEGTEPEPRPGLPSGHFAGAKSVPFMALLDTAPSGATMMKNKEALAGVFKAAGVDINSPKPLVGSCGSGVTACVPLLGLELLGRSENIGLYDGSWTEWALKKPDQIVNGPK